MRRVLYWMPIFVAMMSLTIPAATSFGQDDTESADPESAQVEQEQEVTELLPGEKTFNELNGQYEAANEAFSERSREARSEYDEADDEAKKAIVEEMQSAQMELREGANTIGQQMLELAGLEATDKAISFRSIMWVLDNSQGPETRSAAVELLVAGHLDNPEIVDAIPAFTSGFPSQATEDLLTQLAENGNSDEIKGVATISLISYLMENMESVAGLVDNEEFAKQYPDSIDYFKKLATVDDERIEGLLAMATESFGEVEHQGTTIAEMAAGVLKQHLQAKRFRVGSVAPDIEGPDLDGTDFKLSDYRGKVVMVDFWGDW